MISIICIAVCRSFAPEAAVALKQLACENVILVTYPDRCGRPPLNYNELKQIISGIPNIKRLELVGGCCLSELNSPPPDFPPCGMHRFSNCFELAASKTMISALLNEGSYLVTPGWLLDWQRHVEEWGFSTRELASEFFTDFTRQVALLDTEISAQSQKHLQEFSDYVGLSLKTLPIGIDLLKSRLEAIINGAKADLLDENEKKSQKQSAEYAVALDMLSKLSQSVDEEEIMANIRNLYQMLFAAKDVFFTDANDNLQDFSYSILPSKDGFVLPITSANKVLTVATVSGVAMPCYIAQYLSLALSTTAVCGLALHKARLFREIAEKKVELEEANRHLRKNHEQMLRQEKMASIGQLAAGVAHEINNPIGFITSNLATLAKYLDRIADYQSMADATMPIKDSRLLAVRKELKFDYVMTDAAALIMESLDGATRVKNIVNDLKNFSSIKNEEPSSIDLNRCVESAINMVKADIKQVDGLHYNFGTLPLIQGFSQQLTQVFLNLLLNAIDAISENAGVISIKTWRHKTSVFATVSDTGCGIPEELLPKIFDPFFTTKDVGSGTGLGLSISFDTIKKHGGQLTVESREGRGTIFTVRLPIAKM